MYKKNKIRICLVYKMSRIMQLKILQHTSLKSTHKKQISMRIDITVYTF